MLNLLFAACADVSYQVFHEFRGDGPGGSYGGVKGSFAMYVVLGYEPDYGGGYHGGGSPPDDPSQGQRFRAQEYACAHGRSSEYP